MIVAAIGCDERFLRSTVEYVFAWTIIAVKYLTDGSRYEPLCNGKVATSPRPHASSPSSSSSPLPSARRIIRKSRPAAREAVLSRIKCIVVDEVDRLVDVLSKNASPREVEKRKRHARPIVALMERVIQAQPDVQVTTLGRSR